MLLIVLFKGWTQARISVIVHCNAWLGVFKTMK